MTRNLTILTRVSSLAIAAALTATAAAQSFQGDPTVTFGTVNITEGAGTTDLDVLSTTAVIDWTPDDNAVGNFGAINFQPSGTTATFSSGSNFAVLNRINVADPNRLVGLNGTINSLVDGVSGQGSIFFYSPSGFVIGSSAVINVGSLVLSASPIDVDGSGNFLTGTNGTTVRFNQAINPAAAINTVAGSQITASNYVALVAPRIQHQGIIKTDGAAALVAAEAATINFSPDGLFDIQVDIGTDDANGIDIDGGTIARKSVAEGVTNHYAYLVAVAKNDAVTMLIRNGGSVGFDTATSAAVEDNVVILSGGRDISSGGIGLANGTAPINLNIDSSTFSTDVDADISGGADIRTSSGNTSFGNNLSLSAGADSIITAVNGNTLSIGGTLFASANAFNGGALTTGNVLRLTATGSSTLTIGGDAFLQAQSFGSADADVDAGDAVGGTVIVQTGSGSTIDITGNLGINVDGFGGVQEGFGAAAGDGTGGTAHILANGGGGASLHVGGTVDVSANGEGGTPSECQGCEVTGGNGTGGTILLQALVGTGNQLDLDGTVTLNAQGNGGAGDLTGGVGQGGTIQLVSGDGGAVTIGGNLTADASASGGFGLDNDVDGGQGGNATGGNVSIIFSGAASTINLNGTSLFRADGNGGSGVLGGNGVGGFVNLQASNNGALTAAFLGGSADGSGGSGFTGGTGTGGRAWVQSISGGDIVADTLSLSAEGSGGNGVQTRAGSSGAVGGAATGGYAVASADGAGSSLAVTNTLDMQAGAQGGRSNTASGLGGNAIGGQADIFAANSASVTLSGFVSVDTSGQGGGYFFDSATGGSGTGGIIFFQASNGATLHALNEVQLDANGIGGFSFGDCNFCGGTGGDGTGGTVTIQAFGGAATQLTVDGEVNANAIGFGSTGFAGPGGNGQGGTVRLAIQGGASADFLSNLFLNASGNGGWQTNGGVAGNGTGGLVDAFTASGGTLDVTGFARLDADGFGGQVQGTGGTGGNALGGEAHFEAQGGTATFSDLDLHADATGGDTQSGTGGNAQSGRARLFAIGGTAIVNGDLTLTSISTGGSGDNGGNAIAVIGNNPQFTAVSDARVVAGNGSISVGGATSLDVHASGGSGANGGAGGNASAGYAVVHALNRDAGAGTVTLADLSINADAHGGQGGFGINGNTGTDGGSGGSAQGGFVIVTASAGNGHLDIGNVDISADGFGGNGGDGGNGDGLAGGNGGDGGAANGGFINVGTESGVPQALGINQGTADFTSISATANAVGGNGGSVAFGTPPGVGGDGGDATGGLVTLLVRGSTVTVGNVAMEASATGGDGGLDANDAFSGNGGDAESDEVNVVVTNRAGDTSQRGTLTAGAITGTVIATGGSGAIAGPSAMEGGTSFTVENSDAHIASLDFNVAADSQIPDLATDSIAVVNGTVQVDGGFSFVTDGVTSIYADNGTLNAGTFTVSASNFVHDPARQFPTSVGTIGADTFSLTTGQDLIIDAHLISTGSLSLIAPGLIDIQDATSGGDLLLQAGSSIDGGTQAAAGSVTAFAPGNVTLGNVNAGSSIDIESANGDLSLGFLNAATFINLDAAGDIGFGDVTADDFEFDAGGDVNGGDIIAGTQASGDAGGAVNLGDINVGLLQSGGAAEQGFAVGITSATSINVGNVAADEAIGFATLGNLTTGSLDAGTDVLTLVGGNTVIASISAPGRTYHGDAQMFLDAGGPDNFDPALVFAQAPVRSGGSYTVTGAISTGTLQVGAASIGTGNISASNGATLDAAGSVSTGGIDAGSLRITAGTDISTGDIFAFDGVDMDAGGSIQTGDIAAGSIDLTATNDISTGDLTTQILLLADQPGKQFLFPGASITLEAGGDISTGDISSIDGVYANAGGSILTGDIDAVDFVEAHAGTSLTNANIGTGDYVLLTAGTGLTAGAVSGSSINARAGGTATVGGAWSAGNAQITSNDIEIGASGSINAGTINLVSTNATQTVVGDDVTGGGYQLSDAEYDRLHAPDISVFADAAFGAAPKMLIGDLSVNGADGEGIHDYEFMTGDSETGTPTGSIRILGDALFSNMGTTQSVGFTTGTFELDAATGLLSLENGPGTLGGQLFLNAARIHVAEGSILDQLAVDPQYDGYQQDLNAPAATQRPDGVIRASVIELNFGDAGEGQLNTLYVQNMGTADTPAGFLVSDLGLDGGGEGGLPPGSLDLIINGQIVTQQGTLTGIDVRDLLVEGRDLTPFTTNSTINGCLLVGPCQAEGPFPPGFTPTPGIQDEVDLIDDGLLPPPPFGNEDFIDDNLASTEDGLTSPIEPPVPLFDSSALGGKSDVDDPVSGSGNPGLMETPACQSEGSTATGQCKEEKQP